MTSFTSYGWMGEVFFRAEATIASPIIPTIIDKAKGIMANPHAVSGLLIEL